MHYFIDKILLYISCLGLLIYTTGSNTYTVVIALFAILIATLYYMINSYAEKLKFWTLKHTDIAISVIYILWGIISLSFHPLGIFLPLLAYDFYQHKLKYTATILGIIDIIYLFNQNAYIIFPHILLTVLAILLSYKTFNAEKDKAKLVKLIDTSTEHDLTLEKNIKILKENQDNMVYVATLQERNRIAREIHDNVGHMLTRSILLVGAIKTINKDEALIEPLDSLNDTLNTAMSNVRESVHDLHDNSINLQNAIADIISTIDKFEVEFEYDIAPDISRDIKYCFISIIKEATNNAIKHSNGSKISIIAREHPAFYQLLIADNGTVAKKDISGGIGLINIEDRVKALGGTIKITNDNGFKIFISIMK